MNNAHIFQSKNCISQMVYTGLLRAVGRAVRADSRFAQRERQILRQTAVIWRADVRGVIITTVCIY